MVTYVCVYTGGIIITYVASQHLIQSLLHHLLISLRQCIDTLVTLCTLKFGFDHVPLVLPWLVLARNSWN